MDGAEIVPSIMRAALVTQGARFQLTIRNESVPKTMINDIIIFTARCYASAVLAMGLCPSVCLSVCLCLCLSQAGVLLKRQNVGSHKQHRTIPPGTLVFWCQRSPRNSNGVTPYEGAECRWGGSKSATFGIYPAISPKTVKDRHIVSIKVE